MTKRCTLERLRDDPPAATDPTSQVRAGSVRRLVTSLLLLMDHTAELSAEIKQLARQVAVPLTAICGVGLLTAGMLAGYLGPDQRFATNAQVASHAGVAPLEASSAGHVRHRLNRSGQRQLNAVIHRIALTQLRCSAEAKAYVARREGEGKTRREAIRALKRFIVRRIWQLWRCCDPSPLT